jgi:hypothetical protein
MTAKAGKVTCKVCRKEFERIEWLNNKDCDRPDVCSCPEVQRAMRIARATIDKATTESKNIIKVDTHPMPTQRNVDMDQLYMSIQPIQVIEIQPPSRSSRRGRS